MPGITTRRPRPRWTETDPWGRSVHCGEVEWQRKITAREGLAAHEDAVRATIRRPDRVYGDPQETAQTRRHGNPQAVI